jgi:hypothetical protein
MHGSKSGKRKGTGGSDWCLYCDQGKNPKWDFVENIGQGRPGMGYRSQERMK